MARTSLSPRAPLSNVAPPLSSVAPTYLPGTSGSIRGRRHRCVCFQCPGAGALGFGKTRSSIWLPGEPPGTKCPTQGRRARGASLFDLFPWRHSWGMKPTSQRPLLGLPLPPGKLSHFKAPSSSRALTPTCSTSSHQLPPAPAGPPHPAGTAQRREATWLFRADSRVPRNSLELRGAGGSVPQLQGPGQDSWGV